MGVLFQDLRYGLRMLAKNPGFTAVAVVTLALGIGANTAVFTIVDAAALRTLPVTNPDRLVRLSMLTPQGATSDSDFSYPDYEDIREQVKAFSGAALCYRSGRFLNSLDESSQILVDVVSPDYFTILGVKALLGQNPLSRNWTAARSQSLAWSSAIVFGRAAWERTRPSWARKSSSRARRRW